MRTLAWACPILPRQTARRDMPWTVWRMRSPATSSVIRDMWQYTSATARLCMLPMRKPESRFRTQAIEVFWLSEESSKNSGNKLTERRESGLTDFRFCVPGSICLKGVRASNPPCSRNGQGVSSGQGDRKSAQTSRVLCHQKSDFCTIWPNF